MQKRHLNRDEYFKEQGITTEKYVIPFIQDKISINESISVLEIGCGEGGNLTPFAKVGCKNITGVDISKNKIENAIKFFNELGYSENVKFIYNDIYNLKPEEIGQFDVIITRDVLEHIYNQDVFMNFIKKFLKPEGKFFLGFPPWQNPFGGHQQICNSRLLSKLPFFHILPRFLYKTILKVFGESESTIKSLLEIKDTGITIEKFEKYLKKENYKKEKVIYYFINPNYEIKFGLKPREAWKFVSSIPFLRNFFITTNYYLISKN